jgi:hypothetical protein
MEWDSVPLSLIARKPDTSEFGIPAANFEGDCDRQARSKPPAALLLRSLAATHILLIPPMHPAIWQLQAA